MKRSLCVVVFVWGATLPSGAQTTVQYEQNVDRTAVWVGDRFRYSITLTVPPGAHVALEDLGRRSINFAPFVLTDAVTATMKLENGAVRHTFDYFLVNYEVGDKAVELPRIVVRSQPAGQGGVARAATEEIVIPALPLAVRSTLNRALADSWIEESLPVAAVPRTRWVFLVVGVLGLLVSSLPAWLWLRAQAVAWRARRSRPSRREFLDRWARSLDELEQADKSGDIKLRCRSLETLALEYGREAWNLPHTGVTPEEFRAKMAERDVSQNVRDVLGAAVDHAQNCRYAPAGAAGSEEELRRHVTGLRTLAT